MMRLTRTLMFVLPILASCSGSSSSGSTPNPAADTTAPVITAIQAEDATRFVGGDVVIEVTATDDQHVQTVTANVTSRLGFEPVTLLTLGDNRWQAVYQAPANLRDDGVQEEYLIAVQVVDATGNQTTGAEIFAVPAPAPPPGTPSF